MQFDSASTALVLIDLQQGIVPLAKGRRSGEQVVATAKTLAQRFRDAGAPVFLVHVSFAPGNAPSRNVDQPSLPERSPEGFETFAAGLRQDGDFAVLKHHWGAFTGTDLDLLLRRHGVKTIVLGGIATQMGVESTARSAWELSYDVVIVEDACAAQDDAAHDYAIRNILPHIARVTTSEATTLGSVT